MDDLAERRLELSKKIAAEREALYVAFSGLEQPLRRVEQGIRIVASIRFYWKQIAMWTGIFSVLLILPSLFGKRKKKVVAPAPVVVKTFPEKQKGLFLWIGRAWRAYRWYLMIREWLAI